MNIEIGNAKPVNLEVDAVKIYPLLEDLYVVPSGEVQKFKSEEHYGYNEVTVKNVELEEIELEQNNFNGAEILPSDGKSGFSKITLKPREPDKYCPGAICFKDYAGDSLDEELRSLDGSRLTTLKEFASGCTNIERLDLSKSNITGNITNLASFAYRGYKLREVNLENCNLANVTELASFLYGAGNYNGTENRVLLKIDDSIKQAKISTIKSAFSNGRFDEIDVSEWDLSGVKDFSNVFSSCYVNKVNFANAISSNATDMGEFAFSSSIKEIDFTGCDTSNITDFHQALQLTSIAHLDLSMFDFGSGNQMSSMFGNMYHVETLNFGINYGKGFANIKSSAHYNASLTIGYAWKLNKESIIDVFNKLYDLNLTYDVANGGTLYTQNVNIYRDLFKQLTEEDILIATNKGWTVKSSS